MSKEKIKKDEKLIAVTGDCKFIQAEQVDGEPEKLPTVSTEAYNGGKMVVGYWGEVVIDLSGMSASPKTPILYGHNTYDSGAVLGQTDSVDISNTITARGSIMGKSDDVQNVVALSKNGYQFQVSVGATPLTIKSIQEGESVEVNGQTQTGPFTLIVTSKLKEISILPLGADDTTSAAIAAAHNTNEGNMSTEKETKELAAEQIKAEAVKASKARVSAVMAVAKDHPDIMAEAIDKDWDKAQTEAAVLAAENETLKAENAEFKKEKEKKDVEANRPDTPHIVNKDVMAKAQNVESITASAAMALGLQNPEKHFSVDAMNVGSDLKVRRISDLVRAGLASSGKTLDCSVDDTREFLQAAFSTRDISNVLSNLANKFINSAYGSVEQVWREITSIRSVNDFKTNTGVRLTMTDLLQPLAPNGEIQHGQLSDSTNTISADTKALMLGLTRQDIINDDLGILAEIMVKFGYSAGRTLNTDFWTLLKASTGEFTSGKGNLITPALSIDGLRTAQEAFMKLTDDDGNPVSNMATTLLVGPGNATLAEELYVSTNYEGATAQKTSTNTFKGKYKPAASVYLNDDPWWLTGNPMGMPMMKVAFLNGRDTPIIESADADFNTLGVQMRCYFDYGISFWEDKAAVYSNASA
jgi:hypothetical protein